MNATQHIPGKDAAATIRKSIKAKIGDAAKVSVKTEKTGYVIVQIKSTKFDYYASNYEFAYQRFTTEGHALNDTILSIIKEIHVDNTVRVDGSIDYLCQNFSYCLCDTNGSII